VNVVDGGDEDEEEEDNHGGEEAQRREPTEAGSGSGGGIEPPLRPPQKRGKPKKSSQPATHAASQKPGIITEDRVDEELGELTPVATPPPPKRRGRPRKQEAPRQVRVPTNPCIYEDCGCEEYAALLQPGIRYGGAHPTLFFLFPLLIPWFFRVHHLRAFLGGPVCKDCGHPQLDHRTLNEQEKDLQYAAFWLFAWCPYSLQHLSPDQPWRPRGNWPVARKTLRRALRMTLPLRTPSLIQTARLS